MPFSTTAKNTMLDALSPSHVSLHDADPGASGTNELSGGSYARVAATFDAASSGARELNADVDVTAPAGSTVAYVGYWTALSGGTFLGADPVTSEAFAAEGTYRVLASGTSLSITDS